MPLELHVWGPGFGLPSIDAESLGAIAYLKHCIPAEEWTIVSNSDLRACPLGQLPALKDGTTWISRFSNIVTYLREVSYGDWDLNKSLNRQQFADCAAFASFIESRGQPLLDLSHYVSSENYNTTTKVVLSHVLTWPGNWTIPGTLRDQAKKRSEHLGLSSLDVDAALQELEKKDAGLTAQIPERLRRPKQTLTARLNKGASKDRFRLDAVTAEFMEPIEELLGRKDYLLGDDVTSLDCLAVGYLALMRKPDLPQAWLKDALQTQHKVLERWVVKLTKSSFEEPLPSQALSPVTPTERAIAVVETLVEFLPFIGRSTTAELPQDMESSSTNNYAKKHMAISKMQANQRQFDYLVLSTLSFGAFIGYMVWTGVLTFHRSPVRPSRRDFGAAGAMLGLGYR